MDAMNSPQTIEPGKRDTVPENQTQSTGPVKGLLTRRIVAGLSGVAGYPLSFNSGITAAQIENPIGMNPLLWSFGSAGLSPLRILTFLSEISPPVAYSCDMNLRLMIPAEGLGIVGGLTATDGSGYEQNDKANSILDKLWDSLPDDIGGLHGLQTSLALTTMFAGMACLEAVPAKGLKAGVARIWPCDPLTIEFARPTPDSDIRPYQRQTLYNGGVIVGGYNNLYPLNTNTFFWRALDNWPDSPYGTPQYATTLPEVLLQLAICKDLKDSIHANAWPTKAYGFNFKNANEIAVTYYHLNQEQAKEYVAQEYLNLRKNIAATNPDDAVIYDSEGSVETLEAGDYSSLPAVLDYLRANLFWSMKELPALMGVDASNADSYNTISWLVKAQRLESMRAIIMAPLIKAANLHFRLLGLPYIARASYEKLRSADDLIQAQSEETKTRTITSQRDEGYISQDEAAIKISGSKPARTVPLTWERKTKPDPAKPGAKSAGNNAGQTTEDQKATRRANKGTQK